MEIVDPRVAAIDAIREVCRYRKKLTEAQQLLPAWLAEDGGQGNGSGGEIPTRHRLVAPRRAGHEKDHAPPSPR